MSIDPELREAFGLDKPKDKKPMGFMGLLKSISVAVGDNEEKVSRTIQI